MTFEWSIYSSSNSDEVSQFTHCNSGSFFHEPAFFDYHESNRFKFKHLLCRKDGKIVAWLPGHQDDCDYYSPAGASYGGPLWRKSLSINECIESISCLKDKLQSLSFKNISLQTPPPFYFGDNGFALSASGFVLSQRWACHALNLAGQKWPEAMRKSKRYEHRKSLSENLTSSELCTDDLSVFNRLLMDQSKRKKITPTHNKVELENLNNLLPNRIRLFGTLLSGEVIAAVLVFIINPKVAYSFYIVTGESGLNSGATLIAIINAANTLKKEGFHWLDLGPSTFDNYKVNTGLVSFKESLGSTLFTRDLWSISLS